MRDIRQEVFETLRNDTRLTDLLANGEESVYSTYSKDAGTYPVIVITEIDNVPRFADDSELINRIRMQITIMTDDGEYNNIESFVLENMYSINGYRDLSTTFFDGKHNRVLQFIFLVDTND